ncbi:phosphodiesterase [Alicyclobacillus cellulosilyticus]|uniref:Phosphodiesterase n=1 Tax=Alicyclobacillus cellulosilyticus TaxID=1003997 RepID=A0A917KBU7_9BACL|nr:phosphodiesterase [Alicyclobacillus cellulosilyticus]
METVLAVLTDVHGNYPALRAVLDEIDGLGMVERIVCLGDMIAIGPDTNEVLEALFSRDDVSMVSGNHEDAVLALCLGRPPQSHGEELEHHQWIADRMDKRFVPLLARLPRSMTLSFHGRVCHFVHYHLDAGQQFLPVDWAPSGEKLDELYQDHPAELVAFGHHHPVHLFRTERRLYFNPGALGCCDRPVARYGLVHITGQGMEVECREVPYDNRAFLRSYHEQQVPARAFILRVFHGGQGGEVGG